MAANFLFGRNPKPAAAPTTKQAQPAAPAGADALVKDTTTRDFTADVIQASRTQPVLVDFWATWCGPCKQLTPILEKAVKRAGGKVRLVKMDIDKYPDIPGQLGIQSIPAVIAFKNGQPVDGFMGALPESQVNAFIERLVGPVEDDVQTALAAAEEALAAKDHASAAALYSAVLQAEPENAKALGGLIRAQIATNNLSQARGLLANLPAKLAADAAVAGARAALEVAEEAAKLGNPTELSARIARDPADFQARFDLAAILNAKGDREGAVEQLIEIVRRDRTWNEDGARKRLVQFFDAWGPKDPATQKGRQRLSSLLFA